MTYEEIVEKAAAAAKKRIGSGEHIAIQFNLSGEEEGAFYVEVSGKDLIVKPYEYFDRDILVVTDATTALHIIEGKEHLTNLFTIGRAYGDPLKASLFDQLKKKGTRTRKLASATA